jgi:O-acetyl-ADP-ribose deacetylase (regulator of RNase III)
MVEIPEVTPVGMKCPPIEKNAGKSKIRLQQGDLTALPVEAWVFYAREDLDIGSGYGTAITMRGGVVVRKALEEIGSLKMGEAAITTAGEMKAEHIIHAVGPKFQEPDLEQKLNDCMKSALKVAKENNLKTVAFPLMGHGFYGVPAALSAKVMLANIKEHLSGETSLEQVIICVQDYYQYVPTKEQLEKM